MNTRRKSIKVRLGTKLRLDELKAKGDACDGIITKPPVFFCRRYDMQNLETQCLEPTVTDGPRK